jgi:hypothetical protein
VKGSPKPSLGGCHNRADEILRPAGPGADEETELTANLTTFREGKAVEMVHYPNAADALSAVGL